MALNFPAGTTTIRNLTPKFSYFLVVKPDPIIDDIPQVEYFVYRFKVPVSAKDGIKYLTEYFKDVKLDQCQQISDIDYATKDFIHPSYTNQKNLPLRFQLKEIPIYLQSTIGVIDLQKDIYQYGSKPIILDETSVILEDSVNQRSNGNQI